MEASNPSDQIVVCLDCGCRSTNLSAFREVKVGFMRRRTRLCPLCAERRQRHDRLRSNLITFGGLFLFLLVWFLVEGVQRMASWSTHFILMLCVLPMVLVPLHELGHVLAARLLGMKVLRVVLGSGKLLGERRVAGIPWEWHLWPLSGATWVHDPRPVGWRRRRLVMVAAGPLVNLGLALAAWGLWPPDDFMRDYVQVLNREWSLVPLWVFGNLWFLLMNLVPYTSRSAMGPMPSDGLLLLALPFMGRTMIGESIATSHLLEALESSRNQDHQRALQCSESALAVLPDHFHAANLRAVCLLELGRIDEARGQFLSLLARPDVQPIDSALVANNAAWTNLMSGRPALLEQADEFSRRAWDCAPWMPIIKGTRGAVLAERGHLEEAEGLLLEALQADAPASAHAYHHAYLALAARKRGNAEACEHHMTAARACPDAARRVEGLRQAELPTFLDAPADGSPQGISSPTLCPEGPQAHAS